MDLKQNTQLTPIFEKYKSKLHKIYERIPRKVLRKRPEIEKLVFPEPQIVYDGLGKVAKFKKMKIPKGISESKEKNIISLNEFKEVVKKFNKVADSYNNNDELKIENKEFADFYDKLLKEKNKFSTGTYLDQKYLIDIANQYAQRGVKIPKISNDKNIFKSNPLILNGVELEYYFLYNLGDKNKSSIFLQKMENIVNRKITNSYILSDAERRRLEYLKQNEKPKGYIPLNILIPKLKSDINKTQASIDNLEQENKDNSKSNNNNDNIINYNYDSNINIKRNAPNSEKTRNKKKYVYDYSTNITNSNSKIKIKKSLSLMNHNKYTSRINSSSSTKEYDSKRFSFLNSHIALPFIDHNKSNINSALTREKNRLIYPVKVEKRKIMNYLKQKLLNNDNIRDILSGNNRVSNTIESENIQTLNSANSISNKRRILRKSLQSIHSINSLTTIRKNSMFSASSKDERKNLFNFDNEIGKSDKDSNNKDIGNKDKENEKEDEKKKLTIEYESNDDIYKKCESIFDSILTGKFHMKRNKSVLNNFLKARGYKNFETLKDKDNVLNINRMKKKSSDKNYILEEYKIRNGENGKAPLSDEQQSIIERNSNIIKKIQNNEYIFKKLICEKNINKDEF